MKQSTEQERDPLDPMCCPNCGEEIADSFLYGYTGRRAGSVKSSKKTRSSRRNGLMGGRPKMKTPD